MTPTASSELAGGVDVERDVPATMRDGVVLRADVYRPGGGGRHPALVCRTAYGKRGEAFGPGYEDYEATARGLAARGYVVIVQDVRGRYASDGEYVWLYRPESAAIHAADGYDTTEWAAELPGSDGRVGTFGNSYDGYTALRTFGAAPPSLAAGLASGIAARMHDESRGIFEPIYLEWVNGMAPDIRVRGGDECGPRTREEAEANWELARGKWLWALPWDALPDDAFGIATVWLKEFLRDQATDPWALPETYGAVGVPVCHVTGWWDFVVRGTVANFLGLREHGDPELSDRHRLVIGPWSHKPGGMAAGAGAVGYGPDEQVPYHDLVADWYDATLGGRDDLSSFLPAVSAFVLNENRWRHFAAWPPPCAEPLELFLDAGSGREGVLSSRPPGRSGSRSFDYDPRDPLPSTSDWATRAVDQRALAYRNDVLSYVTEPLEGDLLLVGDVRCVLWLATDGVETDVTAKLVEVRPDGLAIALASGILRTRFLEGYDRVTRLDPDTPYELTVELSPVGVRLARGSRIRLDVSSSDFPNFDRNHNTGAEFWSDPELRVARQTVFAGGDRPSRLVLPVLSDETAL